MADTHWDAVPNLSSPAGTDTTLLRRPGTQNSGRGVAYEATFTNLFNALRPVGTSVNQLALLSTGGRFAAPRLGSGTWTSATVLHGDGVFRAASGTVDNADIDARIATWARATSPSGQAPISRGGTNAGSASGARTNLGLGTAAVVDTGSGSGDVALLGTSGRFGTARLGSGTRNNTTVLYGDGVFRAVSSTTGGLSESEVDARIRSWARAVNPSGTAPINRGGTGSATASGARTNLGLGNAATFSVGNADGELAELGIGGRFPTARLGSGTASSSTFLRGDGVWAAAGGGGVTVSATAPSNPSGGDQWWDTSGTLDAGLKVRVSSAWVSVADPRIATWARSSSATGTAPVVRGGTGSGTPVGARSNLGLGSASTRDTGTASGDLALLSTGGRFPAARLGSGTASSSTYLRGDLTWATVTGGTGGLSESEVDARVATWARANSPSGQAPLVRGGTGSGTAAGARTNLQLGTAALLDSGISSGRVVVLDTTNRFNPARLGSGTRDDTTVLHGDGVFRAATGTGTAGAPGWSGDLQIDYRDPDSGVLPQFEIVIGSGDTRILEFDHLSDDDEAYVRSIIPGVIIQIGSHGGARFTVDSDGFSAQSDGQLRLSGTFAGDEADGPTLVDGDEYRLRLTQARPGATGATGGRGAAGTGSVEEVAFRAGLDSVDGSINSSSWTDILAFDAADVDIEEGGTFTLTTPATGFKGITIPTGKGGRWKIAPNIRIEDDSTTRRDVKVRVAVYRSGTLQDDPQTIGSGYYRGTSGVYGTGVNFVALGDLEAGDVVRVQAQLDSVTILTETNLTFASEGSSIWLTRVPGSGESGQDRRRGCRRTARRRSGGIGL